MTESQVVDAVRARMEAQWAVAHSSVPLFWANEQDDLPDSGPFASVSVSFGAARIAALGGAQNNIHRQSGEVIIRLFDESVKTSGGDTLMDLVSDAAAIFRGWISGQLRFYASAPSGQGQLDGNVFQRDVIANFEFDLVG